MKSVYVLLFVLLTISFFSSCFRHSVHCPKFNGGSTKSSTKVSDVKVLNIAEAAAGILTAGEIHDFSKWKLWQDIAKNDLKTYRTQWQFEPKERYTVQIKTHEGKPIVDCKVELLVDDNKILWTSRTDNTGKTELWANIFSKKKNKSKKYSINAHYNNKIYTVENTKIFQEGINVITYTTKCNIPNQLDICFAVDATGSMEDEISYLKEELKDIINKIAKKSTNLEIRLGSLFYRCFGNSYVTRKIDLSTNINQTIQFINNQNSGEGGVEAVEIALEEAINKLNWSEKARARLLFLILDEPPGAEDSIIIKLQSSIMKSAERGIRIIPIVASGTGYTFDKSLEYLMRSIALATNGTYVFITDHSGVGNTHTKPTTDEYDVELFNNLILRLIYQYTYTPSCTNQLLNEKIQDTMYVYNPDIIEHVIIDSMRVAKYNSSPSTMKDTIQMTFNEPENNTEVDTEQVLNTETLQTDSVVTLEDQTQESFNNFKYYPNPTKGQLFVEIEGNIQELFLADITGKLIQRYTPKGLKKLEINIANFPTGIYFLKYLYKEKWLTGKVVLTH